MSKVEMIKFDEDAIYGGVDPYSEEGVSIFKKYCVDNGVHYYGRPRELFNINEAYAQAEAKGCKYLIAEDMS